MNRIAGLARFILAILMMVGVMLVEKGSTLTVCFSEACHVSDHWWLGLLVFSAFFYQIGGWIGPSFAEKKLQKTNENV